MGVLYHGSSTRGLKSLEPRKSTHGVEYVYATTDKNIATVFSKRCGDDLVYTVSLSNDKIILTERIPGSFKIMFNNSSSIYTVPDDKFKTRVSTFNEVVATESVDILEEDYIENVYDRIQELARNGEIDLYEYPNRPESIPQDDSDLLDKTLKSIEFRGETISKYSFERLFFLHPNLLDKINDLLRSNNLETYNPEDLVSIFKFYYIRHFINTTHEFYIEPAYTLITNTYPDLKDKLDKIKEVDNLDKEAQVNYILDYLKGFDGLLTDEQIEGYRNTAYISSTDTQDIYKSIFEAIKENSNNKTK